MLVTFIVPGKAMSETEKRNLDNLQIVGGHPAADFVNTVHAWTGPDQYEYLHNYTDLVRWNENLGLISSEGARQLLGTPEKQQKAAYRSMAPLREVIHRVLQRAAARCAPDKSDLDELNQIMVETAAWRLLRPGSECCSVRWDYDGAPAKAVYGPLVWKTADLLAEGPVDRLKECPGENCGWLFLDTSKNRSRNWCSMKTCGNLAKVKRFRQRQSQ